MATLNDIDTKAKDYAGSRADLGNAVAALQGELETVKRRYLPKIKRLVQQAKEHEAALRATIEASPDQFVRPRTLVMHGIKVGYQKAKGKIAWGDDAQVVKLIRRHFADQFDVLVKVEETPVKTALAQLTAAELKRLGIEVEDTGDAVVIKDTACDVDKLVNALLKESGEDS